MVLLVLLPIFKLKAFLQVFYHRTAINTSSSWSLSQWLVLFIGDFRLNHLTGFPSRHEVNWVVLVLVLSWHLWVLNHCLLGTGERLLHLFGSCFCLDWRVVDLRFLLVCSIHAVKQFADLILTAKILVQIGVVHFRRLVE